MSEYRLQLIMHVNAYPTALLVQDLLHGDMTPTGVQRIVRTPMDKHGAPKGPGVARFAVGAREYKLLRSALKAAQREARKPRPARGRARKTKWRSQ